MWLWKSHIPPAAFAKVGHSGLVMGWCVTFLVPWRGSGGWQSTIDYGLNNPRSLWCSTVCNSSFISTFWAIYFNFLENGILKDAALRALCSLQPCGWLLGFLCWCNISEFAWPQTLLPARKGEKNNRQVPQWIVVVFLMPHFTSIPAALLDLVRADLQLSPSLKHYIQRFLLAGFSW